MMSDKYGSKQPFLKILYVHEDQLGKEQIMYI